MNPSSLVVWSSSQPVAFLAWFWVAGHAVDWSNATHLAVAGAIELTTVVVGFCSAR